MWVRGGRVPCQGVAWVGTARTHRRRSGEAGIATRVMHETLRRARERGQVVSALMPFRASFYEHFGYGLVERRVDWTVPLSVLPGGTTDGMRHYEPGRDFQAVNACRQRVAERGQCDMERPAALWELYHKRGEDGLEVVDRPDISGPVRGWMYFQHSHVDGQDVVRVIENGYEDVPALVRQLHFLASLRDQYGSALITVPADLPLNLLLRETQVPHRPVNHATSEARPYTRMQVRVLDHRRFIEAMHLPADVRGKVSVAVRETEGGVSRMWVEVSDGRARVLPTEGEADFECSDVTWASVVCGDVPASKAIELALARGTREGAAVLDLFDRGAAPFCMEYF
jgi:predicted acetyltransferase